MEKNIHNLNFTLMKKMLFMGIVASAAIAMTGCSSDETVLTPSAQGNAIEFGTYLGRDAQMRGTELTNTTFNKFGVHASYTGADDFGTSSTPNFMYNQTVSKSEDAWTYTPLKYWPTTIGDKVSFFAYAPLAAESNGCLTLSTNEATGAPTVTYTYPSDLTQMVDFVANNQLNLKRTLTGNDVNKVNFTLKHELTRVNFLAKVSEDVFKSDNAANKTKVVITGVKFDNTENFYTKGVYTFDGTTTNTRGTWTFADADKNALNLKSILNLGEVKNGSYTNSAGIALEGTSSVELFKQTTDSKQNYLFLLPVSGLTQGDVTVTINYEIVTADTNLKDGYSITQAEKTVKVPAGYLEVGKAYAFTFQINVNTVDFTATVEDWSETPSDITVDYKDQK